MCGPLFGSVDNDIVVAINNCHSPFLDIFNLVVTDFWFFFTVVACVCIYAFYSEKNWKAFLFCAGLIVAVGCSDFICASVIRPLVRQWRPTNPDNPVHALLHIVNGHTGGKYGFPSCHAANSFAIAVFSSLWLRKKWLAAVLVAWALLECYSRLYLGVHYPSDIIGGIAVGSLMSCCVYALSRKIEFLQRTKV